MPERRFYNIVTMMHVLVIYMYLYYFPEHEIYCGNVGRVALIYVPNHSCHQINIATCANLMSLIPLIILGNNRAEGIGGSLCIRGGGG